MLDLSNLNDAQKEAIIATDGPVLIIAGPGTGKTYTLVNRIAYLICEKNVRAEEIMVVTFTEKAARELLTRISNKFVEIGIKINLNDMYIGTFHSVCLRIMKECSHNLRININYRIMDAFEQTYMVCRNINKFRYLGGARSCIPLSLSEWEQAQEICRYVNLMAEEQVNVDTLLNDEDSDMRFIGKLMRSYNRLAEKNGVMDFSTIQTKTYNMLTENPDILEMLRNKLSYIMVDEYQDTNYIQEQLVLLLSGEKKNICVVGDDDQGMYRFRGATIRNILEFPQKFENCKQINLDLNYRSEPGIIAFYNDWMKNAEGKNLFNWNKYRYDKNIVSGADHGESKPAVYICGGESFDEEKEELLRTVRSLKEKGAVKDYNQIAFLFRSVKSQEVRIIADHFEENGIPVYSPRSDMFFKREEVKGILGLYIRLFKNYTIDLKNNSFYKPLSPKLREYFIECIKVSMTLTQINTDLHKYIKHICEVIDSSEADTGIGLLDIFYKIISFSPFSGYLKKDFNSNVNITRAARNLSEVSRIIAKFNLLHNTHNITYDNKIRIAEEFFNQYICYLYVDGIGEYEDDSEYAPSGCVSFMTIHQSKGLEFPVTVVGSLGNTPKQKNDSVLFTAESRFFHRPPFEPMANIKYFDFWRLYYTAFSRAQNMLILAKGKPYNKYFSPFIENLPNISDLKHDLKPFSEVKKINFKRIYSFTSHISIYDSCPKQYLYYKEYGFAQNAMYQTSVGSLVHATLEDMNKHAIDGKISEINEECLSEWFEINYQKMCNETGYNLSQQQKENARRQVLRYYKHRQNELGNVWKAEEEINLVLPEYILQGVVDLVEGHDDTVEIVDYKTGPKPDISIHPERIEHYRKQLEIYAYLIENQYGKEVSRMHLYYTSTLEGDPLVTFMHNRESINKTISEINNTVKNIESKVFDKDVTNNYACKFCDMRYFCGKDNQ